MQLDSACKASVVSGNEQHPAVIEEVVSDDSDDDMNSQKSSKANHNHNPLTAGPRLSVLLKPADLPIIAEACDTCEDEPANYNQQNIELSVREAAKSRRVWQKRGIAFFESLGYVVWRNSLIFASFLIAQYN